MLRALGYSPAFIYEKFRAEWSDDEGHVVLDHTPIGDVAEIEGKSRWIDRIARELGVKPADYITKSYAELFFEWKRKTGSKAKNMSARSRSGGGRPGAAPPPPGRAPAPRAAPSAARGSAAAPRRER